METTFEQIRRADGDSAALTVRFELTLECLKWRVTTNQVGNACGLKLLKVTE